MSAKIYLSPSNQNANKFITGNTNEGAVWNDIAARLQKLLAEYDCETKMAKVTANLSTRAEEAKAWGADVYIAMHSNAAGVANAGAHGVEVYYDPNKGARTKELAQTLLNELKTLFANRGLRQSSKLIDCYKPAMPSVIGECGFHDNTSDAKTILNNKDKIAQLYCNALVAFLKLTKKGTTPSAPAEKPVEKPVETPVEKPSEKPSTTPAIAGNSVSLVRAPLYASSTTTTVSSYITGTYYYWDSSITNGRVRITNSKARVGVKGQVTGWINSPSAQQINDTKKLTAGQAIKASNMALYYSSTSAVASSRISGTYYLWSASVENNRVRVTNALSRVGVPKQVTGWVNVSDIASGTSSVKKTVAELAKEVIDGKWGNGDERKRRLTEAGYNYSEVQAKVNEMLKK